MKRMTSLLAAVLLLAAPAWAVDIPALVSRAKKSVVQIETFNQDGQLLKTGTGFFISADGVLLTNYHVVSNGNRIIAKTVTGTVYPLVRFISYSETDDVAELIFLVKDAPFLTMGSSSGAVEGQHILVVGNPEGLEGTVSDGIISAFRVHDNKRFIQITAPISPGSSGSPVLDENGQVLGIATLMFREGQSLNFAISSESARDAIIRAGFVSPPPPPIAQATPTWTPPADESEQTQKIISEYTEQIRLKPDNFSAYLMRGACYGSIKEYGKAISDYTEAIRLRPDYITAYKGRAGLYDAIGNHSQAKQDREKARELEGSK